MGIKLPFISLGSKDSNHNKNPQIFESLQKNNQRLEYERSILLAERNKLRILLSLLNHGMVVLDDQKSIITINKEATIILGVSELEVLGVPLDQMVTFYEKADIVPLTTYCLTPKNPQDPTEFKNLLKFSTKKQKNGYVELVTQYVPPEVDSQIRWIITLSDMLKQKQIEDMKLDFVSMAAHELRNPLTSIRGYLSVFQSEDTHNLTNDQHMFLNRIEIGVQRLTTLVENLLSVSRIEKGVFTINPERSDLIELISQIVSEQTSIAKEKQLSITFNPPPKPPPMIHLDKVRIGEVIQNLISNAIEYTPAHGQIKIWVESDPQFIHVFVQDTGQGIPQDALPHLFTKFFRVSGKLSHGSKGTGLGLYISKAIVDMHHGQIDVKSEVNKGTTFSFTLPIQTPQIQEHNPISTNISPLQPSSPH